MQKELIMEHYDKRLLAHIEFEAETPIIIGSGNKTCLTDAEILTDVNGLPFILGTSMAGVLRHEVDKEFAEKYFGSSNPNEPRGSEIIFSEAKLIGGNGEVVDGLLETEDEFLKRFHNLPKRNHARIGHKGVTENGGKFDGEVIYKGARFAFEIELLSKKEKAEDSQAVLDRLLSILLSDTFRIGGGTRKGFGKIKPVCVRTKVFDLNSELDEYLETSSKLCSRKEWEKYPTGGSTNSEHKCIKYTLKLTPQDFFYFGSGMGDNDVDDTPVKEEIIVWNKERVTGSFQTAILIPASSLKGALAHRVAFHYNRACGKFADLMEPDEIERCCGNNNPAVRRLFGYNDGSKLKRGCALFSDILEVDDKGSQNDKILNHVKIDRFTGGAMDGALFSEKVVDWKEHNFQTTITIINEDTQTSGECGSYEEPSFEKCIAAFEAALKDIDEGTLPLGGGSGRGHGIFKCEFHKDEE